MADFITNYVTGNQLPSSQWNQIEEVNSLIESSGQTKSSGDTNQVKKAVANYVGSGSFYTDSGVANAYILSTIDSFQAPTQYTDGMEIRFRTSNPNTAASTVNVSGLGVKSIKLEDGTTDINPNDIGLGRDIYLRFDLGNDAFVLSQPFRQLQSIQTFTSSGTWTKPTGINAVMVEIVAGGGGGGSSGGGAISGGGAGGYSRRFITSGLGNSETVTVGSGGGAGLAGSVSSFGAFVSATGGSAGGLASGVGGVGSGGDINLAGGDGVTANGNTALNHGGNGGNSVFGGGGAGGQGDTDNNGKAGKANTGGGGGGARGVATGGAGGSGIVIVYEYS